MLPVRPQILEYEQIRSIFYDALAVPLWSNGKACRKMSATCC